MSAATAQPTTPQPQEALAATEQGDTEHAIPTLAEVSALYIAESIQDISQYARFAYALLHERDSSDADILAVLHFAVDRIIEEAGHLEYELHLPVLTDERMGAEKKAQSEVIDAVKFATEYRRGFKTPAASQLAPAA